MSDKRSWTINCTGMPVSHD